MTLGADWDRLRAQYSNITTFPAVPNGVRAPAYPTCPTSASANFLATGELPPTPDPRLCSCLEEDAWSCQARPTVALRPAVQGALLDNACQLLGGRNSSCAPVSANGTTGTYGQFSSCSALQRLNWAFSEWYTVSNRTAGACSFSANATLVPGRGTTTAESSAAASECLSQFPIGVRTPEIAAGAAPVDNGTGSTNSSGGSTSSGGSNATTRPNAAAANALPLLASLIAAAFLGAFALI